MFTGQHPITKDKDGRYFIDANPEVFSYILDFLRLEEFPPPDQALKIYSTSVFFGLTELTKRLRTCSPLIKEKFLQEKSQYKDYSSILKEMIDRVAKSGCHNWVWIVPYLSSQSFSNVNCNYTGTCVCDRNVLTISNKTTVKIIEDPHLSGLLVIGLEQNGFKVTTKAIICQKCGAYAMDLIKISWC